MLGSWFRSISSSKHKNGTGGLVTGTSGHWSHLPSGSVLQSNFGPTWEGPALSHGRLEPHPVTELSILSVAAQTARPQQNTEKRMFDGKNHPQDMSDHQDHC